MANLSAIRSSFQRTLPTALVWTLALVLASVGAASAAIDPSYGYIRTVKGNADLMVGGLSPAIEATANYPVQVGDQIRVSPESRLEIVLPDSTRLRIDGNTDLRLDRIAHSLDTPGDDNLVRLVQGEMQIDRVSEALSTRSHRIDTVNASLFLESVGRYRVFSDGSSWTQVIVREGYCQVVTESATHRIGPGQQAIVDGQTSPAIDIQSAPMVDGLELWASQLRADAGKSEAQSAYRAGLVSPSLGYASTPLHRHGKWMRYGASSVWRPYAPAGWRPYHSGWWVYTPSGLTWISTEPWGWLTYHYGYWGRAAGIGWVWYPGNSYTPGSVTWYWGETHVGWIPTRPLSPIYRDPLYALPPYGHHGGPVDIPSHPYRSPTTLRVQLRSGTDLSEWRDWTFTPYDRLGYRDSYRYLKTGEDLKNQGSIKEAPHTGFLTTETRDITPNLWQDPQKVLATLRESPSSWSRPNRLTPLGSATLAGPSRVTPRRDSRGVGAQNSGSIALDRTWKADTWRRDHLKNPQDISKYRRDGRSSTSETLRDRSRGRSKPNFGRQPTPGRVGTTSRPGRSPGRIRSSTPPGPSRSIGGARSSPSRSGTRSGIGRSTRPGSRPGAPNGGGSMSGRSQGTSAKPSGGGGSG